MKMTNQVSSRNIRERMKSHKHLLSSHMHTLSRWRAHTESTRELLQSRNRLLSTLHSCTQQIPKFFRILQGPEAIRWKPRCCCRDIPVRINEYWGVLSTYLLWERLHSICDIIQSHTVRIHHYAPFRYWEDGRPNDRPTVPQNICCCL